jgi:hypothetical protein
MRCEKRQVCGEKISAREPLRTHRNGFMIDRIEKPFEIKGDDPVCVPAMLARLRNRLMG